MKMNKIADFAKTSDAKEFADAISFRKAGELIFDQQAPVSKTAAPSTAAA